MRTPLLVSMFALAAACRRAPPPELQAVGTGSAIVPERSAQPDASSSSTAPSDSGTTTTANAAVKDAAAPLDECADSNECTTSGAICCMKDRALPITDRTNPFPHTEYEHHAICTTNPEKDCDSLELCKGSSCRRPQPKVQLRCGTITCTAPTQCVLDLERAPGQKVRAPTCIDDDARVDAGIATSTLSTFSCAKSDDCPRGAHCSVARLGFIGRFDAECAFKPRPPGHGRKTAPMCRDQSDCTKLVDGYWPSNMTAPSRCRPLRNAPSTIRACEVPGNDELF
jgi:hypothetical protein